jgi:SpoVK/Ycf46/Vps4 family AAA+-type ATPase
MFLYVCVCFEDFIDIGETMRQRNEFTTQSSLAANDDEFERMLEEFINSEFEMAEQALPDEDGKTGGEPPHGDDAAADEDDEDAAADASDEDDDDEDAFDDEDDDDDIVLPSGLLEQNGNVTVKVEILRPIKNPRSELDRLVGCRSIKQRMDELLALTRYNAMLRNTFPDNKQHEVSLHSVFLGRPGTGKTTVCKIFGSLLHEAGVLSKGHVVVCNRGTFLGTLWGDEERSVRQVVEMAQGGVLMIDEAYLLNGKNQNDPGRVVLPMLMDILANEAQRDIAVVLCGYKEPMLRLLELNPGLHSRFPNRFEFCDFTVDELLQITRQRIGEYKYHFTRQAWEKYKEVLQAAYDVRDPDSWGNARYVANQLERIYVQHATRIVKHRIVGKRQLLALTPADILPIETPRPRPRIGF